MCYVLGNKSLLRDIERSFCEQDYYEYQIE